MASSSMTPPVARPRIGTPATPDPNLYAHLTEQERMMAGWPYRPADPFLTEQRLKAYSLNHKFNSQGPLDYDARREILKELLHPDSKDKKIYIEPPFRADYGYNLKVGNNFYANWDCAVLDSALVEIGDDCMLAPGVHIYAATHPVNPNHRRGPGENPEYYELAGPVKIGNTCWIGGQSIICPGVTIGDNVVVGAGSVVTKDVPSNVVIGGNPAKIIRYLDGADIPEEVKKAQGK